MGQAMAVMDLAGKGLSVAGKLAEGQASKVDSQLGAFKLMSAAEDRKVAAEAGRVRAVQTDAAYRDELNQTMQNIGAIRSAQNVGFDSPTSAAIYDKAEDLNAHARQTAVSNERIGALSEDMAANNLQRDAATLMQKAKRARTTSLISAIPSALSFGQSAVTAYNGFK